VRGEPDRQRRRLDVDGQDHQARRASRQVLLPEANAQPRLEQFPHMGLVVGAEREIVAGNGKAQALGVMDDGVRAIKAHQIMGPQFGQRGGPAAPRQVAFMGYRHERDIAQVAGYQF
jgi:hypothetical protein